MSATKGMRLTPEEVDCVYNTLSEIAEIYGLNEPQSALLDRVSEHRG